MEQPRWCRRAAILAAVLLSSVSSTAVGGAGAPNVLLVLVDDVGIEHLGLYGVGQELARTPNLDALAARGVVFEHAWSDAVCSPSRARIQTGRFGFRDGVGYVPVPGEAPAWGIDPASGELLAQRLAAEGGYRTAAFGKWHLGLDPDRDGEIDDDVPNQAGYEHFRGILSVHQDWSDAYHRYRVTRDGVTEPEFTTDRYLTSAIVDWAVEWIGSVDDGPAPWFAYVAFLAAHAPFSCPPAELLHASATCDESTDDVTRYRLMIEAMDTELRRLLSSIAFDARDTLLVFASDNGSPSPVAAPPVASNRAKGTVFQGGVRVPMFVLGDGVTARGRTSSIVDLADLHATMLDVAGVQGGIPEDSVSLVPIFSDPGYRVRTCAYTQWAFPNFDPALVPDAGPSQGNQAVRDERYKLVRGFTNLERLFDLVADPWEEVELLAQGLDPDQQLAYDALHECLEALTPGGLSAICQLRHDGEACTGDADCCSGRCDLAGAGSCFSPLIKP